MPPLADKVALVTGASGGIGSAIAQELAAAGAQVIGTYRSHAEHAQRLLRALPGGNHEAVRLDVTDSQALASLAQDVFSRHQKLDILVNNAGVTRRVAHEDLEALDDGLIDDIFTTNWRGAFATVRAFKPLLLKSGEGLIVNISSIAGRTGKGSNVAYCASKAALDSLTRSLAIALAPNIRVVSVSPGWVKGEYADRMPPELLLSETHKTPLGRLATAADVACTVVAVATTLRFSTGCIIPVDGGRPLA